MKKSIIYIAVTTPLVSAAAMLFIRELSFFCSFIDGNTSELLANVFGALKSASMIPPIIQTVVVLCVFVLLGKLTTLRKTFCVIGIFVSFISALFFCNINSIRFGDVVISLIKMISNGALEGL